MDEEDDGEDEEGEDEVVQLLCALVWCGASSAHVRCLSSSAQGRRTARPGWGQDPLCLLLHRLSNCTSTTEEDRLVDKIRHTLWNPVE